MEESEDREDDSMTSDPEFGEGEHGEPRAEASLYVRRQLNEYTDFEEVFHFYWTEPEVSQAQRDPVPMIKYAIVRESRNGIPGFDSSEANTRIIHPGKVPDEVLERASSMVDWIDPTMGEE